MRRSRDTAATRRRIIGTTPHGSEPAPWIAGRLPLRRELREGGCPGAIAASPIPPVPSTIHPASPWATRSAAPAGVSRWWRLVRQFRELVVGVLLFATGPLAGVEGTKLLRQAIGPPRAEA